MCVFLNIGCLYKKQFQRIAVKMRKISVLILIECTHTGSNSYLLNVLWDFEDIGKIRQKILA